MTEAMNFNYQEYLAQVQGKDNNMESDSETE